MSFDFLKSILSPTLIGITLNILPVETLCRPIILISLTKNSSNEKSCMLKIQDRKINFIPQVNIKDGIGMFINWFNNYYKK